MGIHHRKRRSGKKQLALHVRSPSFSLFSLFSFSAFFVVHDTLGPPLVRGLLFLILA